MRGRDDHRVECPSALSRPWDPPSPSRPAPTGNRLRNPLLDLLFRSRAKSLHIQFFRYLFVGGTAAVVDVTLVFVLTYQVHLHYSLSVGVAFVLGSIVNYIGCVLWIFQPGVHRKREISAFLVVGVVGLLLNELTVWLLHAQVGTALMSAKITAVMLGTFWNFTLRKTLVFREQLFSKSVEQRLGRCANGG